VNRLSTRRTLTKRPGQKRCPGIGKGGAQRSPGRFRSARVVEKRELPEHCVVRRIGQTHFSSESARAHLLLHCGQIVLRDREVSVDRIESLDHQQRVAPDEFSGADR
jgi:hypothetical protein